MNYWLKNVVCPGVIFILLDVVFILSQQKNFASQILQIQSSEPKMRILPAIFCYIFLIFSLYYFIIKLNRPPLDAFILGVVIYGVFETTNYSIFKHWNPMMVIIDTLWGGILMYLTTVITYNYIK